MRGSNGQWAAHSSEHEARLLAWAGPHLLGNLQEEEGEAVPLPRQPLCHLLRSLAEGGGGLS